MLHSKSLADLFQPIKPDLDIAIKSLHQDLYSDSPLINKIISYVLSTGGKHIRPALCLLTSKLFLTRLENKHITLAQITEIIHTATLIHDDIVDDADLRRSNKTVKALWDNKVAVISGDYLLARASTLLSTLESVLLIEIFARALEEICLGEIQQTNLLFDTNIDWEEYILKSKRKTAVLFAASMQGSAIISDISSAQVEAVKEYGMNYGLAFQIADDILNFYEEDQVGKPSCDDLRNGIITAPTIYAIEEFPELASYINNRFEEEKDFNKAVEIIKNSSGVRKSKKIAQFYVDKAIEALDIFPDSATKNTLISLAEYVTEREF